MKLEELDERCRGLREENERLTEREEAVDKFLEALRGLQNVLDME